MILKNDILILQIGDQIIYHNPGPLPRMVFDPEAIIGLDDTPDVKREQTPRPSWHGDFNSRGQYEGRLVTISGHAVTNTPEELHDLRDDFAGQFESGVDQLVRVSNSSGSRYFHASQGSKLSWIRELDTYARWKVDLYSANPRIYGATKYAQIYGKNTDTQGIGYGMSYPLDFGQQTTPTTPTIRNLGNSQAYPKFLVTGDLPSGFSITNGANKVITFSGATFSGIQVVIDTYDGTASVGGIDRSYQLSRRDWFSIPPKSSIKPEFYPTVKSTTARVDVEYRDTWI